MASEDFRFGISSNVQGLDLNQLLVAHPNSTYFMRVAMDMPELQLKQADILIIDRSIVPKTNDLAVITVADEAELKVICWNNALKSLELWGTVTYIIRKART